MWLHGWRRTVILQPSVRCHSCASFQRETHTSTSNGYVHAHHAPAPSGKNQLTPSACHQTSAAVPRVHVVLFANHFCNTHTFPLLSHCIDCQHEPQQSLGNSLFVAMTDAEMTALATGMFIPHASPTAAEFSPFRPICKFTAVLLTLQLTWRLRPPVSALTGREDALG